MLETDMNFILNLYKTMYKIRTYEETLAKIYYEVTISHLSTLYKHTFFAFFHSPESKNFTIQ
jgi:hypothetical protein